MTIAEYIAGVREFADWVEANPDAIKNKITENIGKVVVYSHTADEFAACVKVLGRGVKSGDDKWFNVTRTFGPIEVEMYTTREKVCRKITRSQTVEVNDWVCDQAILSHLQDEVPA